MNRRDPICTEFELKQFAFSIHTPNAQRFADYIESKSHNTFTVIEKEFLYDIMKILNSYKNLIESANAEFKKKWRDVIEDLE